MKNRNLSLLPALTAVAIATAARGALALMKAIGPLIVRLSGKSRLDGIGRVQTIQTGMEFLDRIMNFVGIRNQDLYGLKPFIVRVDILIWKERFIPGSSDIRYNAVGHAR